MKDNTLFSYFEYVGNDFDADMEKMAADPTTKKWWDVCKPCQAPLVGNRRMVGKYERSIFPGLISKTISK